MELQGLGAGKNNVLPMHNHLLSISTRDRGRKVIFLSIETIRRCPTEAFVCKKPRYNPEQVLQSTKGAILRGQIPSFTTTPSLGMCATYGLTP